jgi:hypothetical protein
MPALVEVNELFLHYLWYIQSLMLSFLDTLTNSICLCRINQMYLQYAKPDGIHMFTMLLKVHYGRGMNDR